MKIGIFGGTFDPIHHGHLLLARSAVERLGLQHLAFIPNAISPHKLDRAPTPPTIRLEMIRAAIAGEPAFHADDLELRRDPPSFTVDTARAYRARFPDADLILLIGADNLRELHTWKDIADLRALCRFAVYPRGDTPPPEGLPLVPGRYDISSTDIRDRVARGLSIRYLVPETVAEIIRRENLYRGPLPSKLNP